MEMLDRSSTVMNQKTKQLSVLFVRVHLYSMKTAKTVLSIDRHVKHPRAKDHSQCERMASNEELIGGCCVCSDDQGFSNNALVYCDGKGCTVACHTGELKKVGHGRFHECDCLACYGIVSIPDGDWYCRRCEAGEMHAVGRQ